MDGDLLHASFDGADAATSFTGADGVVWTPTDPGAQLTTSTPQYGSACARLGAGGVGFSTDQPVDLGSGDFTIEMWVRPRVGPPMPLTLVFTTFEPGNATGIAVYAGNSGSHFLWWIPGVGSGSFSGGGGPVVGSWSHLALVRIGTALHAYVNGVKITGPGAGGALTTALTLTFTPRTFYIGRLLHNATDTGATGAADIDDLRISNFARYTASFTPSGPNSYTPPAPPAVELAAAGLSVATGTATPQISVPVAASGSVQVMGTGQLLLNIGLSGAGVSTALGAANLALAKELAASGAAQATGSATPVIAGTIELTAAGQVQAEGTATLSLVVDLSAEALAQALGAAQLAIGAPLAAGGTVDMTGSATMDKTVALAGAGQAQVTGAVSLWLTIELGAQALAQASASAALDLQILMEATGVMQAIGGAALSLDIDLLADGQVVTAGQASLQVFPGIAGAIGMVVKPPPRNWRVEREARAWHGRPAARNWRVHPSVRDWNLQKGMT